MGSFSISEVLTILVVILVIFGPDKLPEFARRVGQFIGKSRQALQAFTTEFDSHYGEAAAPIKELTSELSEVKKDISRTVTNLTGIDSSGADESSPGEALPPAEAVDLSSTGQAAAEKGPTGETADPTRRSRTISVVPDALPERAKRSKGSGEGIGAAEATPAKEDPPPAKKIEEIIAEARASTSEGPAGGGPAGGGPAGEGPADGGPATGEPAGEGPASEEPAGEEPAAEPSAPGERSDGRTGEVA